MKNYKAIIIDGKKTIKNMIVLLVFACVCAALIPIAHICTKAGESTSEYIISDAFPAVGAANNLQESYTAKLSDACQGVISFILGFDIKNPSAL